MNWHFAEIISLDNNEIRFKTINKDKKKYLKEFCIYKILNGHTKNKLISEVHKIGDIIFVKKKKNFWKLKQYPKVNGGIVI